MSKTFNPDAALWHGVIQGVHHWPWWAFVLIPVMFVARVVQTMPRRRRRRYP